MMIHSRSVVLVCLLVVTFGGLLTSGQVQSRGMYDALIRQVYFGKRGEDLGKLRVQIPFHDSAALAAAEKPLKSAAPTPLNFAKAIPVAFDSDKVGVWEDDGELGVRTWSLLIESKTAFSLALIFDHFVLPVDGEFYVLNDDGTLGAFTPMNNKPDGKFAIQPLAGDKIFLIFIQKLTSPAGSGKFLISKVVHGFRPVFAALPSASNMKDLSGSCNVDVKCVNSWNNQKRSVIVFMTDQLQKFCSGVMLANTRRDGRQLLLTANHCVFTDLSNSIAGFNYERQGCGVGPVKEAQTAHGMRLLARWQDGDFALFEVVEKIPAAYGVYLSGWDARVQPATLVAGIHHPSGDVKKLSVFNGTVQRAAWAEGPNNLFHWMVPSWTRGVTEPGSSGSPLFNRDGQVIGQLHGGASACENARGSDLYGGLAFNFDQSGASSGASLKPHLDPLNQGIRQLYGKELVEPAVTSTSACRTATVTATATVTTCPSCVPRAMFTGLLAATNERLAAIEKKLADN